jgi:hypothetical protein
MVALSRLSCRLLVAAICTSRAFGAEAQNPSPMVEHTREHPRLKEERPDGRREKLGIGTLFVPAALAGKSDAPLLVFLHGGTWIPEIAAAKRGMAVIVIQGGRPYGESFADAGAFPALLKESSAKAGLRWTHVTLGGWSAGCGGIREILRSAEAVAVVRDVLLIDGVHTGYTNGKPGPMESELDTAKLAPITAFAREAIAGRKRLLVTHSEIFPGTFASTTETADWLQSELGVPRRAILEWGPMKTQQLSDAQSGAFRLTGFAGNAAPDHVDQLHALPDLLEWLDRLPLAPSAGTK